jgi:hypothetical protein
MSNSFLTLSLRAALTIPKAAAVAVFTISNIAVAAVAAASVKLIGNSAAAVFAVITREVC